MKTGDLGVYKTPGDRYKELKESQVDIGVEDVTWLPYTALQRECTERKIPARGKIEILRDRLTTYLLDHGSTQSGVIYSRESADIRTEAATYMEKARENERNALERMNTQETLFQEPLHGQINL